MRVLVCGGRNFDDVCLLYTTLNSIHDVFPISVVIEGGATGADRLASIWSKHKGIQTQTFLAEWAKHGRAAGPLRNRLMLEQGKPDLVVAFPGGAGTRNMIEQAKKAGVKLEIIEVER